MAAAVIVAPPSEEILRNMKRAEEAKRAQAYAMAQRKFRKSERENWEINRDFRERKMKRARTGGAFGRQSQGLWG